MQNVITLDFPKDTVFYPVNMLCIMIALTIHAKSVLPADDLETIPVEQASKCCAEKTLVIYPKNRPIRSKKSSNKGGESSMLRELIEELASPSSAQSTTASQSEISDPGNLPDLYNAIIIC
jgi:hypothetical protein